MTIIYLIVTILISGYLWKCWAYLYDVKGTLEPFHMLFDPCVKHHSLLPKSVDPNSISLTPDTSVAKDEMCDLSIFSPEHLYPKKEDILHECEHDSYLLLLSESLHFHYCKSELSNHDNEIEYLPLIHDSDISLSKTI